MEEENTNVEEQNTNVAEKLVDGQDNMVDNILGKAMPEGIDTQAKINKMLGLE